MRSFGVLLLGRTIYGLGAETLWVVMASITTEWFFDQEISLAFSIIYAVSNISSFSAGAIIPLVENDSGMGAAFGIGALFCLYSFICSILLVKLNVRQKFNDKQILDNLKYLQNNQI